MSLHESDTPKTTGFTALILMLRFYGIAADEKQLAHQYGETVGETQILRCAKDLKLKARAVDSNWERLGKGRFARHGCAQ